MRVSTTEVVVEELRADSLQELGWVPLASVHKRPDFTWACYDLDPPVANKLIGALVKQLVESPRTDEKAGDTPP